MSLNFTTLWEKLNISNTDYLRTTQERHIESVREIVKKEGYKFAVSTEDGPACFSDDLFEIVRVGIYSDDSIKKFALKISGKYPFIREKRNEMKAFRNKIRKFFGIKTK